MEGHGAPVRASSREVGTEQSGIRTVDELDTSKVPATCSYESIKMPGVRQAARRVARRTCMARRRQAT